MTAAVVAAEGLSVAVPRRTPLPFRRAPRLDILAEVSLAVRPGEIVAVVGESGSGKTTLGRALVGLTPPTGGQIALDGAALPDFSARSFRAVRENIALLFQDPAASFNPRQRVASIVAEPRRIAGAGATDRGSLGALVEAAGLSAAVLPRFPHALSGGQARRVAVARGLSLVPRLIIADEPTAGLDVSVQGGVLNLFLDLRDQSGTAFLIITHNLAVVRHVAERIAVMYLGRIVEAGPARQVLDAPRHPYTRALVASEPVADPRRRRAAPAVLGEVPSIAARPPGCEFHPRCPIAEPRCRSEAPAARAIAADHSVRCHFPLAVGPPHAAPPRQPAGTDKGAREPIKRGLQP